MYMVPNGLVFTMITNYDCMCVAPLAINAVHGKCFPLKRSSSFELLQMDRHPSRSFTWFQTGSCCMLKHRDKRRRWN